MNKKIIFIGGLFPKEIRKEIENNSIGVIQYAADTLQWAIVNGLGVFYNELKILNLLYIGSFPKRYKDFVIKRFNFSHCSNSIDINIQFVNLPFYKLYSRYLNLKLELKKVLNNNDEILVIYAVHTPFIKAAVDVKKSRPNIKICLIVPDLPEFMSEDSGILSKLLKKSESFLLKKYLKQIDSFVLLSDKMIDPLEVGNRPWVRIEGIFDGSSGVGPGKEFLKEKFKTILYTGTLAKRYGIVNLLKAFKMIQDENYRLWICGDGDAKEELEEYVKNDDRITYYGQLSRDQILVLQRKATILVNPRTSEGEYTKYSFPSKTMEYLASGTPCVMNKLSSIPEDYLQYCYFCKDDSILSLHEEIVTVCEKSDEELSTFGGKAKEFIISNKSSKVQCQKIFNMLNKL